MSLRSHATSIALAIAAAGALAYAYLDRGSVTEAEKKTREGSAFGAWRREDLSRIAITHGAETIVLERAKDDAGDAEWSMRAPTPQRADASSVDKLAAALELAAVVRKVDPGASVAGFEAPRASGEIAMGTLVHHFALGGDAPTPEGAAYLRVDDRGIVVVTRDVVTALMQPGDTYRSRAIVPYLSIELARLEVRTSAPSGFTIERADDVSFKLVPSGLRASRAKLDDVWSALAETRAEAFLADAVADALVARPRVTITMTPHDAGRAAGRLRVGDACPGYAGDVVVVRDGVPAGPTRLSACAPKGILGGLETGETQLEDTHLFAAHDDEVAELRIEALPGGPAIELARRENAWREKAPVERDLSGEDAEAAAALVTAIARAEGTDPRRSDAPFEAKGRVTVRRADGGVVEVVELGAPDAAGDVIVRRAFDGARLNVMAAIARKLTPRAVALRGREPWTPRIEGAPVAWVETRCDGIDQRVTRERDGWTMRSPAGYAADNGALVDLVDAVTRARADAWVADADDGHFGLGGAPGCAIVLGLQVDAGVRVARLEIGREGEGGVYARTSDGPAVLVLPKGVRDRARAWLVDLHGFVPAPPLERVTLEKGGKRVAFGAEAGDDGADAVLRAASVLRADAVVHLGAAKPDEGLARPTLVVTLRGGGGSKRVVFGGEATLDGAKIVYARVDGVDATFAVDRNRLTALLSD